MVAIFRLDLLVEFLALVDRQSWGLGLGPRAKSSQSCTGGSANLSNHSAPFFLRYAH